MTELGKSTMSSMYKTGASLNQSSGTPLFKLSELKTVKKREFYDFKKQQDLNKERDLEAVMDNYLGEFEEEEEKEGDPH